MIKQHEFSWNFQGKINWLEKWYTVIDGTKWKLFCNESLINRFSSNPIVCLHRHCLNCDEGAKIRHWWKFFSVNNWLLWVLYGFGIWFEQPNSLKERKAISKFLSHLIEAAFSSVRTANFSIVFLFFVGIR